MQWSFTAGKNGIDAELSHWAFPVLFIDAVLLVPLLVLIQYTLMCIYPVFAIIEDEKPPIYNPVALSSQHDDPTAFKQPRHDDDDDDDDGDVTTTSRTITSSLRAINRLLTSHGGLSANLRGLGCSLAQTALTGLATSFLAWFAPFKPLAALLASLALVQYAAAWVHIVVSHPSPEPFWRHLPPFKRTFAATWKPVVIHWAAVEIANGIPLLLASLVNVDVPDIRLGASFNIGQASDALRSADVFYLLKCLVLSLLNIVLYIFAVIPAKVILVRVQASLLPIQQDAIIPFDRSFQGRVESAVLDGRGYASISDAWSTFTKAGWRRLMILYVKIYSVSFAFMLLCWAVLIPEAMLLIKPVEDSSL